MFSLRLKDKKIAFNTFSYNVYETAFTHSIIILSIPECAMLCSRLYASALSNKIPSIQPFFLRLSLVGDGHVTWGDATSHGWVPSSQADEI